MSAAELHQFGVRRPHGRVDRSGCATERWAPGNTPAAVQRRAVDSLMPPHIAKAATGFTRRGSSTTIGINEARLDQMMQVIGVESVDELTKAVLAIFESTGTRWWFRGQRDARWPLLPSARRGYTKQRERYLTNLFYTRARTRYPNCPNDDDYGGWLALMQHFGLPTRLLDWTHSPLVAAYFATKYPFDSGSNADPCDAAIWALEPHRLNESQGYEPVFPPLNARSIEQLVRPAMKGLDDSEIQVLATSPLESDLKMLTQQGAFTVHVLDEPLNDLPGCNEWLKKIVIPAQRAPDIARDLDVLGFRLADLFPDLQNLAREITNMHRPSGASTA